MSTLLQGAFKRYLHGGYGASVPKYDAILMSLLEVAMALGHLHNLQLVHGGAGGEGGGGEGVGVTGRWPWPWVISITCMEVHGGDGGKRGEGD